MPPLTRVVIQDPPEMIDKRIAAIAAHDTPGAWIADETRTRTGRLVIRQLSPESMRNSLPPCSKNGDE